MHTISYYRITIPDHHITISDHHIITSAYHHLSISARHLSIPKPRFWSRNRSPWLRSGPNPARINFTYMGRRFKPLPEPRGPTFERKSVLNSRSTAPAAAMLYQLLWGSWADLVRSLTSVQQNPGIPQTCPASPRTSPALNPGICPAGASMGLQDGVASLALPPQGCIWVKFLATSL